MSGSSYTNPDDIVLMTMEDVLYMGMKNDISFLVTDIVNMYEQQSTYNPNMPIRKLMYAARLYDKYIHIKKLNIYSTKLVRFPVPKLVTFYNGKDDKEDSILELKDAFRTENDKPVDVVPDIQVRVRMININYGKNRELMAACKPLSDYAWFIAEIRKNNETMGIESAVDCALDSMPKDSTLKDFLIANKAEVRQMCITEYNEAETMEQFREEGRKVGQEEGEMLRLIKIVYKKMLKGKTNEEISDETEEEMALIEQIKKAIIEYKKEYNSEEFQAAKVLEYYNKIKKAL